MYIKVVGKQSTNTNTIIVLGLHPTLYHKATAGLSSKMRQWLQQLLQYLIEEQLTSNNGHEGLMATGAFSQNVGKLFSKLKLVTDNLFIYAKANWKATERLEKFLCQAVSAYPALSTQTQPLSCRVTQ